MEQIQDEEAVASTDLIQITELLSSVVDSTDFTLFTDTKEKHEVIQVYQLFEGRRKGRKKGRRAWGVKYKNLLNNHQKLIRLIYDTCLVSQT